MAQQHIQEDFSVDLSSSPVSYSQLSDIKVTNPLHLQQKEEEESTNDDEENQEIREKPRMNVPLILFLFGYISPMILFGISLKNGIGSFHLVLPSFILLFIVSLISLKWIDRECLCFGCIETSYGAVSKSKLNSIWIHFISNLFVIAFGLIFHHDWENIVALIAMIL